MATPIKYKTYLSTFTKGERPCYWAKPVSNGTITNDGIIANVATRGGFERELVEYIVSLFIKEMRTQLKDGKRLELEQLSGSLSIQGTFPTIDAGWDKTANKMVVHMNAKGELAHCLDDVTFVNVTESATVVIKSVLDTVTQVDGIITQGANVHVLVSGSGLLTSTAAGSDEGCWLADEETGTVAATGTVTASTATTLDATFATVPEPGSYRFVLATRGGLDASHGIVLARRKVTVVAADAMGGDIHG